jgi:uncharacterized membrane protein YkoI
MDVPLPIVSAAVSAAVSLGVTYGVFRTRLGNAEKRLEKLETKADAAKDAIHAIELAQQKTAGRVSDIAELKETTVSRDVFRVRMDAQDDVLQELRIAVDRKVSIGSMAAVQPDERPAPPPPPMRPRLPSRPR